MKDQCPFCDYKIITYDEFVKHAESNHEDDYLTLLHYEESGTIEVIQVDEIIAIEKSE
ncbi:MAG: hypothetical protein GPJ54_12505 [Candidatus Heimdallarchaeota archaeon]|nr:hypothetical protein [Candidatus Heimdallarchaeota archaeon]